MEKHKPQTLTIRVPRSLHIRLKDVASEEGTTLNQLCLYLLSKGIEKRKKDKNLHETRTSA